MPAASGCAVRNVYTVRDPPAPEDGVPADGEEARPVAGVGIAVGLLGSIGAATLIRGLLFGVRSWDAATLIAVSGVLAISALLA